MKAIWVEITRVRGSSPRDVGTAMRVDLDRIDGTIGGGRLEYEAILQAREMLSRGEHSDRIRAFSLGPNLGQCCGGAVELKFTRNERPTDSALAKGLPRDARASLTPLWVWGAGHVGRAIVREASRHATPITWIDTSLSRFPSNIPAHVTVVPTADMSRLAANAPPDVDHLILTYSHEIDFALCETLLGRKAFSIGLIGSDTKKARFFKRLRALGLNPEPITCPIGDKSLGKRPDQIAAGVIAARLTESAA